MAPGFQYFPNKGASAASSKGPSVKKEFPGYFANGTADIEKLWGECLFVLDANVLLSLYRYSDSTRAELFQVFEAFQDRIWVPHQVAHEYLVNRLSVIGDQVKIYDDALKKVEALRRLLDNASQQPFVSSGLLASVNDLFGKLIVEFKGNQKFHEGRISSDEIKDRLEVLFEGKVGGGYDRIFIDSVLIAGKARYDEKIPPGYADIKKGGDSPLFVDRCKPYGDYIAWLQIIDKAKSDAKPVVFITGDVKEDWWVSSLGRTVGPQPQLVEEFRVATDQSFYMYTPDRFLERAGSFLKQEPTEQSLNEIRDVRSDELATAAVLDAAMNSWPVFVSKYGEIKKTFADWALQNAVEAEHDVNDSLDLPWNQQDSEDVKRKALDVRRDVVIKELALASERRKEFIGFEESIRAGLYNVSGPNYNNFLERMRQNAGDIHELELELSRLTRILGE